MGIKLGALSFAIGMVLGAPMDPTRYAAENTVVVNPHAAAMASFAGGVQGFASHLTDASRLWRDADRTLPVSLYGHYVHTLEDLSGNGNHASQPTASLQSEWQGDLKFLAADDFYVTPVINPGGATKATLVLKIAPESNASNSVPIEFSAISGSNPGSFVLFAPNTSTNQYSFDMRGTSATVSRAMPGNVAPLTSTMIVDMDLLAGTVAGQLGIELVPLNGTTTTSGLTAPSTTFQSYALYIGRRGGTTLPFKGRIIAIGLIFKQLTTDEKTIWRDWANSDFAPAQTGAIANKVVTVKRGDQFYLRTRWTSGVDLVQRKALANGVSTVPETVNFMGARLIPNTQYDVVAGFNAAVGANILGPQADDATPFLIEGSFLGANHGHDRCRRVPATAHGKTTEDIGTVWTDTAARRWVLMRIVDANTLEVISENQSTYPVATFHSTLSGTTLTYVAGSGGLHTGNITIGTTTAFQMYPATNNHVKAVKLNGSVDIANALDGIYISDYVDVQHDYNVMNTADLVTIAKNNVGNATLPNYASSSTPGILEANILYQFNPFHGCTVYHTAKALITLNLGYVGFTQAVKLTNSGTDTLWAYVPRMNSITIGANTYDLSAQRQFTTWPDNISLTSSYWADAQNPPASMTHLIKNSGGTKQLSFTQGYLVDKGIGIPATRVTLTTEAGRIAVSTGKHYMVGLSDTGSAFPGSVWAADQTYTTVAYRSFSNLVQDFPYGPEFSVIKDGNEYVVTMDFDTNVTTQLIALSSIFDGWTAAKVNSECSASFTLHSITSSGGLSVTTTGGKARGQVRLTPP